MKNSILMVIILAALSSTSFCSEDAALAKTDKITFLNNPDFFTVPLQTVPGDLAHAYIKGKYNGQVGDWLVDTGWVAEDGAIRKDLVLDLKKEEASFDSMGADIKTHSTRVKGLGLLDSSHNPVARVDFSAMELSKNEAFQNDHHGFLGVLILKDYVVKFDFPCKKLTIYKHKYFKNNKGNIIQGFTKSKSESYLYRYFIPTKINGLSVTGKAPGKRGMILDTGNYNRYLAFTSPQANDVKNALKNNFDKKSGVGFGSHYTPLDQYKNVTLELDGFPQTGKELAVATKAISLPKFLDAAGDLGYPAFENLTLILDYPGVGEKDSAGFPKGILYIKQNSKQDCPN
jgi:hypothetical protein